MKELVGMELDFAGRVTGGVTVCAVASGGGFGDA